MDNVLAKPADLCCLKGAFHTGEPTGSIEQIEGIDTYVARPHLERSNKNVILFFPDAFGLHMNSFLMMDAFAECGYLTLGVDYFLGVRAPRHFSKRQCYNSQMLQDPVTKHSLTPLSDPNFDFEAWKSKHLTSSEEVSAKWVEGVKAKYGTSEDVEFACVGYWLVPIPRARSKD
jgi:hypothetical protein